MTKEQKIEYYNVIKQGFQRAFKLDDMATKADLANAVAALKGGDLPENADTLKELADLILQSNGSVDTDTVNQLIEDYIANNNISDKAYVDASSATAIETIRDGVDTEYDTLKKIAGYITSASGFVIVHKEYDTVVSLTQVEELINQKISEVQPVFQPVKTVYVPISGDRPKISGEYNTSEFVSGVNDSYKIAFAPEGKLVFYTKNTGGEAADTLVVANINTGDVLQEIKIDDYGANKNSPYYNKNIIGIACGSTGTRVQIILGLAYSSYSYVFRLGFMTFEKNENGVFEKTQYSILSPVDNDRYYNYNTIKSDYTNTTLLVGTTRHDYSDSSKYNYFAIMHLDDFGTWVKTYEARQQDSMIRVETNLGYINIIQNAISSDGTYMLCRKYDSSYSAIWVKVPLNNGVPDFNNCNESFPIEIQSDVSYPSLYAGVLETTRLSADNSALYIDGYNGYIYQYLLNADKTNYEFYKKFARSRVALGLSLDGKQLMLADSSGWTIYTDIDTSTTVSINAPVTINQGLEPHYIPVDITLSKAFTVDTDIVFSVIPQSQVNANGDMPVVDTTITFPAGVTAVTSVNLEHAAINIGYVVNFDIKVSTANTTPIATDTSTVLATVEITNT